MLSMILFILLLWSCIKFDLEKKDISTHLKYGYRNVENVHDQGFCEP